MYFKFVFARIRLPRRYNNKIFLWDCKLYNIGTKLIFQTTQWLQNTTPNSQNSRVPVVRWKPVPQTTEAETTYGTTIKPFKPLPSGFALPKQTTASSNDDWIPIAVSWFF